MNKDVAAVKGKKRTDRRNFSFLSVYAIIVYIFLYAPLIIIVFFSFSATKTTVTFGNFSLDWYRLLLKDKGLLQAVLHSLEVGIGSVFLAIVFGVSGAFIISRFRFFGKELFKMLCQLPMILPGIILGIAILLFFVRIKLSLSPWTVLAGHVAFTTPFVMFQVGSRIQQMGMTYEDASNDLGANPAKTFFLVTLPMIKTSIIGGALLAFTISFDEIIVTYFLTGTWMTLPVYIYGMMRFGLTPQVYAISAIILIFSVFLIFFMAKFTNTKSEEAER